MFIYSNLAISLDGKIGTPDRAHLPLGTPKDREQMQVLRRRADAIVMGASSLRAFRRFCQARGKRGAQPANVIISSRLEGISASWPFFQDPSLKRILCITSGISARRAAAFRKSSEVIELQPRGKGNVATQVVDELAKRGVRNLLVEGGGGIMWEFVKNDLIDEFHVTLTPWIIGGCNAPTLVDGAGFGPEALLKLELVRSRRVGNELYLVYRRPQRKR